MNSALNRTGPRLAANKQRENHSEGPGSGKKLEEEEAHSIARKGVLGKQA